VSKNKYPEFEVVAPNEIQQPVQESRNEKIAPA